MWPSAIACDGASEDATLAFVAAARAVAWPQAQGWAAESVLADLEQALNAVGVAISLSTKRAVPEIDQGQVKIPEPSDDTGGDLVAARLPHFGLRT